MFAAAARRPHDHDSTIACSSQLHLLASLHNCWGLTDDLVKLKTPGSVVNQAAQSLVQLPGSCLVRDRRCGVIKIRAFDDHHYAQTSGASVAQWQTLGTTTIEAPIGRSAGDFVRMERLNKAAEMLGEGEANVTEVAYSVGYRSLSQFAKAFREQFGMAPSDFEVAELNAVRAGGRGS